MRTKTFAFLVRCALATLVCTSVVSQAQTVTGSITGEITDSSGAAIPKAQVTVQNVDTGVQNRAETNEAGVYSIRFLPIGHYGVVVEAQGFTPRSVPEFTLEINQTVKLNEKLAVGSTTTAVVVNSEAPILNTNDGTLGVTISSNEISTMPLNGRNFSSITLFQPGAVSTSPTALTSGANALERNTTPDGIVSINGNRAQANNYTLDGVDLNEGQNNLIAYNVAPDAIGELKVISANAPATYGNVNGGSVVSVLKSGTDHFHGSAYGFLQNENLDANSWGNKHANPIIPINPYTESIFGGTVGGPIIRQKFFFFADYEGERIHTGGTGQASVIPAAFRTGDFSSLGYQLYNTQNNFAPYANNQVPVVNPVAKFLFTHPQFYPEPNSTPTGGDPSLNNFQGSTRNSKVNNQGDFKLEWDPRAADKVTGFYSQSDAFDTSVAVLAISFPSQNLFPTKLGGATWVHTFSPSIVNEARIGFTRVRWDNQIPTDPTGAFGLNGNSLVGIPFGKQAYVGFSYQNFTTGNISGLGTPGAPAILRDNTFSYGDNLTIQRGKHLISAGVQAIRYQQNYLNTANQGSLGSFNYSGVFTANPNFSNAPGYSAADFVANLVTNAAIETPGGLVGNRQWRVAGFVQDDWKLFPSLTINVGLRYEYDQPWYEVNNKTANVLLNSGTVIYAGSVPAGAPAGSGVCGNRACYQPNYDQFMPRVGFALQVRPRVVVRGGYGATSFFEGNASNQRLTYNQPFVAFSNKKALTPTATGGGTPFTVQSGFSSAPGDQNFGTNGFGAWPQNIKPAYIQEFNLTTEYELTNTLSLMAGYVGELGQHLIDYRNGNQLTSANAVAPFVNLVGQGGTVLVTESDAASTYNAGQLTLRQRLSHGLEYTVNYTYAQSLSNSAGNYAGFTEVDGSNGAFENGYNGHADYGPATSDVRHNLSALGVYAFPFGRGKLYGSHINRWVDEAVGGWSMSTVLSIYSGFPLTLATSDVSNTNTLGAARPNQYRRLKVVNRSATHWFGTDPSAMPCNGEDNGVCAYGTEIPNTFGTAGIGTERAPGYTQVDASAFKDFHITERQSLGFRADAFNVFNIANYGNPGNNIQNVSTFGQITSVRGQERRIQLALHYNF
jgi:Carboxypeptidase regulatory-like domain